MDEKKNLVYRQGDLIFDVESGDGGPFSEKSQKAGSSFSLTNSGDIVFRTGGAERARINAAGVGSGLLAPDPVYPGTELGYAEFTTSVSITAIADPGNVVVTAPAINFDGTPVWLEFFAPEMTPVVNNNLQPYFRDETAGTVVGRIQSAFYSSGTNVYPGFGRKKITPAAGTRTYSVRAVTQAGTASISGGSGGSISADVPGYIRITKA